MSFLVILKGLYRNFKIFRCQFFVHIYIFMYWFCLCSIGISYIDLLLFISWLQDLELLYYLYSFSSLARLVRSCLAIILLLAFFKKKGANFFEAYQVPRVWSMLRFLIFLLLVLNRQSYRIPVLRNLLREAFVSWVEYSIPFIMMNIVWLYSWKRCGSFKP